MNILYPTYDYAIQNQNEEFYNGCAYGDKRDWTTSKMDVFTYTEYGAHKKLDAFPIVFNKCKVVRVY